MKADRHAHLEDEGQTKQYLDSAFALAEKHGIIHYPAGKADITKFKETPEFFAAFQEAVKGIKIRNGIQVGICLAITKMASDLPKDDAAAIAAMMLQFWEI